MPPSLRCQAREQKLDRVFSLVIDVSGIESPSRGHIACSTNDRVCDDCFWCLWQDL